MTSEEIKQKDQLDMSEKSWLKEIAYQLALLNEKPEKTIAIKQPPRPHK